LLGYVSINLIRAEFDKDEKTFEQYPFSGKVLAMLSFATSIDAFDKRINILGCLILLGIGIHAIISPLF